MFTNLSRVIRESLREGGAPALAQRVRDRVAHEGRKVRRRARRTWYRLLGLVGGSESERSLIRASTEYWTGGDRVAGVDLRDYSHWQGAGPWRDHERWLRLGRVHFRMYEQLCSATGTARPIGRMMEWGGGGGANAVHFVDEVGEFCSVEISQASLEECARVLSNAHFEGFKPVLIKADSPEQAVVLAGSDYDFFLCTYVFELLPGKQYAQRILSIAQQQLRPGGIALIQIRYDDGTSRSSQKRFDYYRNSTRFTSFRIEEFWDIAERMGFKPLYVELVPRRTEDFSGDLYAYFSLRKPAGRAGIDLPS